MVKKTNKQKTEDLQKLFRQLERSRQKFEKMSDTEKIDYLIENLALQVNPLCPDNKEKGMALSKLMEVGFWLKTSVAKGVPTAEIKQQEVLQISNVNGTGILDVDFNRYSIREILMKLIALRITDGQVYMIKNIKTGKSFCVDVGLDIAEAMLKLKDIVSEKYFNEICKVPSKRDKPIRPKPSPIRVKKERE